METKKTFEYHDHDKFYAFKYLIMHTLIYTS